VASGKGRKKRDGRDSKKLRRDALVVLGMHRSGTSALAGMLGLAGAQLPSTLMSANSSNPRGFFESDRLFELHEELLAELRTHWRDISPLPSGFASSPEGSRWTRRLAKAVDEEFGDAPLLVLKDPRICRLVPLWERVLSRKRIRPAYILAVRNPLDVAASLRAEHDIDESTGLLLWLDHVLRAERDTRGRPRVVITYERLLQDWRRSLARIQDRLKLPLTGLSRGAEAEIDAFLSRDLRRQQAPPDALKSRADIGEWIRATYAWARQAEKTGADATRELDRIGDQLMAAEQAFGPVVARAQREVRALTSEGVELRAALDDARQERNRRSEELAKTRSELLVANQGHNQLQQGLEAESARAEELDQERRLRADQVVRLQGEVERLGSDLADQKRWAEDLVVWTRDLLGWSTRLATGRPLSSEARQEMAEALESSKPEEVAATAAAALRFGFAQAALAEQAEALSARESELATRRQQVAEQDATIRDHAATIEELRSLDQQQRAELADRARELEALRNTVDQQRERIEDLDRQWTSEVRSIDLRAARLRTELEVAKAKATRREHQAEASHRSAIASLSMRIASAEAESADRGLYLEHLEHELGQVRASRTWRLLSRVRRFVEALRR